MQKTPQPTTMKKVQLSAAYLSARAERLNSPAMGGRSFSASQETVCN